MAFSIPCPHCGLRPVSEFRFGGEIRAGAETGSDPAGARQSVYLRDNLCGEQEERWFHALGCGCWIKVRRNTLTNEITEASAGAGGR